jgi:putative hemolysin
MPIRKAAVRVRRALRSIVERCLGLRQLRQAYERIVSRMRDPDDVDAFLDEALRELDLYTDLRDTDLDRVPDQGPLVVVANHPHGIVDGLLLAALLRRRRPDLRVLGNRWLNKMPELRGLVLDVDPIGGRSARSSNTASMRAAHRWLGDGGALLVFPAGKISARRWGRRGIHDDRWSPHTARLQQHAQASVLPVHIGGHNSWLFQLAGLIHPRLRTLRIARETMKKRGSTVAIRIGNAIPQKQLQRFDEARELVDYLRLRTEILARRHNEGPTVIRRSSRAPEPIVAALPADEVQRDIDGLPTAQRLVTSGDYEVWYAWAPQAPSVLREIGRLREETFRKVGEGTNRSIDLDRFDANYLHLFVWHRERRYLVGAYRLGHVDKILIGHDQRAFYTNTLYDYDLRFLERMTPGLELGRSFVVERHQREFLPLLLLWRGIAAYVRQNPRYSTLFGAVSISDRHHDVSKHLMLDHLQNYMDPELSGLVQPRHPVPAPSADAMPQWTKAMVSDLGEVSAMVSEIETEQRGVPVLLREYLKLGGRLVGLNVDPSFNHSITALVVIDMRKTNPRILGRYMGKPEAAAFFDWHQHHQLT